MIGHKVLANHSKLVNGALMFICLNVSSMRKTLAIASLFSLGSTALLSTAQASDWGCQVILCLSNPGGATQFAECRPPIQKLWKHLAKGRSFPTCTGSNFSVSRPVSDPYRCDGGLKLVQDDAGAVCMSAERTEPSDNCNADVSQGFEGRASTAHYVVEGGKYVCRD